MGVKGDAKAEALTRLRALPETLGEMVRRPHWVVWKYENRDGKPTKVPYEPVRKRRASTTDSSTWSTFEEALAAFEKSAQLDGIGYVFAEGDPYSGIDLDDCLDEAGQPFSWAQEILQQIDSYTEISPSGKGLKLFVEARLPAGGRRKGSIEMYESGRYFTVTGRHFGGTPRSVETRQAELEALHQRIFPPRANGSKKREAPKTPSALSVEDQRLLDQARTAKNGEKFRSLFDQGDLSGYGQDASRADLALCSLLAFWCQDEAARIDHLFRHSKLMRPKWDQRRGDLTYGARTLAKALELVSEEEPMAASAAESTSQAKPTQAQLLVALATDLDLFHTADATGYATVSIQGRTETWPLRSTALRRLLARRFFEIHDKPPGSQGLQDALLVLEAKAQFDGPEIPVFLRIGEQEGRTYLDLADPEWRCVEISAEGWRVLDTSPVKFRRSGGMLPLPVPVRGGSLEALRELVNLPDEESFILYCSFLVAALRPRGPYPALTIQGEQGSAKSTAAKVAKELIDPSAAPLRTAPRDERDLMIAASNSWLPAYDNLSKLPPWVSDALCRLATGGGFSTRLLYTDDEERIFSAMRPSLLNGIEDIATRPDLLDRCLVLTLKAIPDAKRRTAAEVNQAFETARPGLLGALLDAVSCALRNQGRVKLSCRPRMADFAMGIVAAEPALPWAEGAFLEAYLGNRSAAVEVALEADDLAVAVQSLVGDVRRFQGTASELLECLNERVGERVCFSRSWPQTARSLSGRLRRAATVLRSVGIEVRFERGSGRNRCRRIVLEKARNLASVPSEPSAIEEPAPQGTETKEGYRSGAARTQNGASDANRLSSDANASASDAIRTQTLGAANPLLVGFSDGADGADAKIRPFSSEGEDIVL